MLDVYVDASLGRRCGCAAVVFKARSPLPSYAVTLTVPLPGGLTPNEGEMAALLAAARLYRETLPTRDRWQASEIMLNVHTDSATCVRLLYPQPAGSYPDSRFGKLAKQAAQAWTALRTDESCLGWTMRNVARSANPAGPAAVAGLRAWRKAL